MLKISLTIMSYFYFHIYIEKMDRIVCLVNFNSGINLVNIKYQNVFYSQLASNQCLFD